jgi:hypothetical protein
MRQTEELSETNNNKGVVAVGGGGGGGRRSIGGLRFMASDDIPQTTYRVYQSAVSCVARIARCEMCYRVRYVKCGRWKQDRRKRAQSETIICNTVWSMEFSKAKDEERR